MDEILAYLKKNPTYFLATMNGDQPEIRPFGTICKYQDQLYIQTGMSKDCYKQIVANPKISLCAFDTEEGSWLRLNAVAVPDAGIEACEAMLSEYPGLRDKYAAGDGNTVVLALTQATATISSFTAPTRTIEL